NPTTSMTTPSSGQANFMVTLFRATTQQIDATDITGGVGHAPPWQHSLSTVLTANAKPDSELLLLLPGETATPGSGSPGKSGVPNPAGFGAGTSIPATVQVVDQYFNPVITHSDEKVHI